MVESVGHEGAVEYLDLKVNPYNDETFRYWCYDTPGLINPDQVGQTYVILGICRLNLINIFKEIQSFCATSRSSISSTSRNC